LATTILQQTVSTRDPRADQTNLGGSASAGDDVFSRCNAENTLGQFCNSLPLGVGEGHHLFELPEQNQGWHGAPPYSLQY
jgi:hypothetical protein